MLLRSAPVGHGRSRGRSCELALPGATREARTAGAMPDQADFGSAAGTGAEACAPGTPMRFIFERAS